MATTRRRRKPATRKSLLLVTALMLAGLIFMTWIFINPWRDAQDLTWVQCDVVDAQSQRGGRNAATPWYVVIETRDCGRITYRVGTSQEKVEGIAANITPGAYEFKFGRLAQKKIAGHNPFDNAADAKDMRPIQTP